MLPQPSPNSTHRMYNKTSFTDYTVRVSVIKAQAWFIPCLLCWWVTYPDTQGHPFLFTLCACLPACPCAMDSLGPIPYLCTRHSLGVHKEGTVLPLYVTISEGTHFPQFLWLCKLSCSIAPPYDQQLLAWKLKCIIISIIIAADALHTYDRKCQWPLMLLLLMNCWPLNHDYWLHCWRRISQNFYQRRRGFDGKSLFSFW